ncbi:MAG TPA: hypothetical protein VKV33_00590 [Streptosporangiaceae bacterium]|nr:hypothetical protein [Streptosporangiaceae bacterium]
MYSLAAPSSSLPGKSAGDREPPRRLLAPRGAVLDRCAPALRAGLLSRWEAADHVRTAAPGHSARSAR